MNRFGLGAGVLRGRWIVAATALVALAGTGVWMGARVTRSAQVEAASLSALPNLGPFSPARPSSKGALRAIGHLPLMFEPNVGQTDSRVKFMARGSRYGLFLTGNEAVLSLAGELVKGSEERTTSTVRMQLRGASSQPVVTGTAPLPGKSHYFIGNDPAKWHRSVPQYARVKYAGVYPGVDLVYYGNQGELEYDFEVAPGADPKKVELGFEGADKLALENGDLVISTGTGSVRLHAPKVYQGDPDAHQDVNARFALLADNAVGFDIGEYDQSKPLVIDPILSYSTYLGGGGESLPTIAVDAGFNLYIAGTTTSPNFPINGAQTAYQTSLKGASNAFIAKFDPTGRQLLLATYLGGTGIDIATGVAVDAASNVYVAGYTTSTDFPTNGTIPAFQTTPKTPGTHAFVAQLTGITPGTAAPKLNYSTYLSGSGTDLMSGVTIDSKGVIYVIGTTTSTDFPIAPSQGAYQNNLLGPIAFFVSKIDPGQSGTNSLVYSTYFGGSSPSNGTVVGGGIAVDNNATTPNIFITGGTNFTPNTNGSTNGFPILNAAQACLNQPASIQGLQCTVNSTAKDAFIAKINPANTAGAQLIYSTYLGGSGDDIGYGIGLDSAGSAYVTGSTTSPEDALTLAPPGGGLALQKNNGGQTDAFVGKVTNPVAGGTNSDVSFSYFTFLGGSGDDSAQAIAVDSVQGARIVGTTTSTNLPVTSNAVQSTYGGGTSDAFVANIDTTGANASFVSYLGGSGTDRGSGVAVDSNSVTYVAGDTNSPNFPTANAIQNSLQGTQNAFAAKLGPTVNLTVSSTNSAKNVNAGNQATFTYTIKNVGDTVAGVAFIDNLSNSGVVANFVSATTQGGSGSCPTQPTNNTIICNVGVLNGGANAVVTVTLTPTSAGTLANSGSVIVAGSPFTAFANASVAVNSFTLGVQPPSATVAAGNPASYTPSLTPLQGNSGSGVYSASISMSCPSGLPNGVSCVFASPSVTLSNPGASTQTLTVNTTARTSTTGALHPAGPIYAMWLPIGGLAMLGAGFRSKERNKRLVGLLLGVLLMSLIVLQPACSHSSSTTINTGTPAGTYAITVAATSGTFSQTQQIQLVVQ